MPLQDPPASPVAPDSRRVRVGVVALLLLAALIGLAAAFEGVWLRPLIQHHVQERSGRRIDFDALHLGLDAAWRPTVRLRNLVVQNAPWAAPHPLVRAAEFGFTLSWATLRGETTILTRLEMVDAEFDLERQADGLRNWRLTRPDDRGPGRLRVLSIDARNTHGRIVDGSIGLELEAQSTPLTAPTTPRRGAGLPPLTQRLTWQGTRDGLAFEGDFLVSETLTLLDTGQPFSLQGEWRVGASRAVLQGSATDLLQPGRLDLDLRLAGPRIADLGRVVGWRVRAPSQPIEASGRLVKEGARWSLSAWQARWGRSQLAGELQFERKAASDNNSRSMLHATLTSQRLNLADLRSDTWSAAAATSPGVGGIAALDADLTLAVAQLDGLSLAPVEDLNVHAALRDGRWAVDPLGFTVAGGHATGSLAVDTSQAPAAYALDLRLRGMQLAQLARNEPRLQSLGGALDLRLALRSRGDSLPSLAGTATGSVQAELVRATIPAALDAKLALDGGRLFRGMFGGAERTAVTCSALDFRFDAGRGTARRLALETPQLALTGTGSVDLGRGAIDIVLTPRRKQTALLSLDRAVQFSGALRAPKATLVDVERRREGEACAPGSVP